MLERIAWFAVLYACVSITVTILMLVFTNKALKLGGPFGMVRTAVLIVLAVISLLVWIIKSLFGAQTGSPNDEIKKTIRTTSRWVNGLKNEWDKAKRE